MNKKYLSLVLSILLIGVLVFSSSIAFASEECTGPKVAPTNHDFENGNNQGLGPKAPLPGNYKAFKIDLDQEKIISGTTFNVNSLNTVSTDPNSKFEVTITHNDVKFAWESNMPVYMVWVKGGNQGGNLYSYYDEFEEGVYNDCGLSQPPNNENQGTGSGWSHIIFYYLEQVEYTYETAWARGSAATDFKVIEGLSANNWGWTNKLEEENTYQFELLASKNIPVGTVTVVYENKQVTVTYEMFTGYTLEESHVWVGKGLLPTDRRGRYTNAPGQLYIESETFEGPIYVAFHAVVGIPVVD